MKYVTPWKLLLPLCFVACGDPSLEAWHTTRFDEEFTADRSGEVRSFEDYRELEDRLFTELENKVYTQLETGPEYALHRYSAGSAADPQNDVPNWNRSFELTHPSPRAGVLLLHGMSDSPYSLRAMAEMLVLQGYQVVGLRLPGHGTAPSGLRSVRAPDMIAAVRIAMKHLAERLGDKPIHIVGYSTGATLAIDFALDATAGEASPVPASLVLISPAIRIHPSAALSRFKNALAVLPGLSSLAWLHVQPEFDPYKYNSFATNAADVVHRLTRSIDSRIATRSQSALDDSLPPILVFKSTVDATVTTEAIVDNLLGRLAPGRNELVLFDINRSAAKSMLLVSDPGPLTRRLEEDDGLPFALTLVTNQSPKSRAVVARHKPAYTAQLGDAQPLSLSWPSNVISLSHVALPIPPDDPLYGQRPPDNDDVIFLGEMALVGERGLMKLPDDWLLRLRYNPFYEVIEQRVVDWFDEIR